MSPVTIDDLNTPMVVNNDSASSITIDDLKFDENPATELKQGLEELDKEEEDNE
ncbi:hypothetical protein H4S07_002431 [Coemansia furcata]|uniref:Uncharacterized protein n=1 Tax=Coemansia furcata TaxID=417177 RepID=A0ACC1LLL6_9FUNG|nr:hypothetical protein H4S07_002431 [Coemansia furcata]